MATGSSGNNPASKAFDFAADDILCSYQDYDQDASNGVQPDQPVVPSSATEFHKNRMARAMLPSAYSPPEESFSQGVASAVENIMKKQTDNVMRFLEGISSRLSQLELYCYNVDKSIGEMRSDLERDHSEADLKLRTLDKHLQEVHRSVQILKDKQELAETQKELAKLQLAQKETSSARNSQLNEERSASSTPDPTKKADSAPDMQGMQLAIALPHQLKPIEQQQTVPPQPLIVSQSPAYYVPAQLHYVQSDSHYRVPPTQDVPRIAPLPAQSQANQVPQIPSPHYQQQWVQQLPQQQQMTPLQSSMQTQVRPQLTPVYSQHPPIQPVNPTPESLPNSMPIQMPYPTVSQPGTNHAEATSYVYMGPNRTMQQQPQPQQPQYAYMVYESESGRPRNPLQSQQSHFPQSGYPPTGASLQPPQANAGSNILVRPPQFFRGHPHGEVIEKFVSMGYRADHVAGVVQRLEESGQPVDFNALLDRLSGHSSGRSQGGWSG